MRPTPRERLLIALEEIRHDGSGAQEVFDWFGERTPERTEAWLSNCEATLRSLEEDTELPIELRGDWPSALKLADNAGGDAPQALDPVRAWLDPAPEGVLSGERVCRLVASGTRVVGGPHTFET